MNHSLPVTLTLSDDTYRALVQLGGDRVEQLAEVIEAAVDSFVAHRWMESWSTPELDALKASLERTRAQMNAGGGHTPDVVLAELREAARLERSDAAA